MWKTILALSFVALCVTTFSGCSTEEQSEFIVCESTYALCTTAPCTPVTGEEDMSSCACEVKTGYSAGQKPCTEKAETAEGTQISSRYYPIKSYVACDNDRPWAWCLDKPCVIDKSDPTKAACACPLVKDKGPYLVVTDTYTDTTCTTGIWSSATVIDANKVTDFLKTNDKLKPFEIKVLNK